jgi:hypothetical protein
MLDALMLLSIHMIFPLKPDWLQFGRLEGFRVSLDSQLYIFATTPVEEQRVDDHKNQGNDPDLHSWERAGSGVGIVDRHDDMRLAEYLIQRFVLHPVSLGTLQPDRHAKSPRETSENLSLKAMSRISKLLGGTPKTIQSLPVRPRTSTAINFV